MNFMSMGLRITTSSKSITAWMAGMYEYLLVVKPAKTVVEKVMEIKQDFSQQYRHAAAVKARPHIRVASFMAKDEMEDTLIRWLQRIIAEEKSFSIALNNYGGFPPHTVFLRVQDTEGFQRLSRQLKPIDMYITSNHCPPVNFISYPFMSIATKLGAAVYDKAMPVYAHELFHESFELSELVLLRREQPGDPCKEVAMFRLQPADTFTHM